MKICITSINKDNYNELSAITWPNKVEYAKRHGYDHYLKTEETMLNNGLVIGFEKIYYILNMLSHHEDYDWIWHVGCDTLVMNYEKKIEDVISLATNDESFIVATDWNGINMDSFLVKNSPKGKKLLEDCFASHVLYNHRWFFEQQFFWDNYETLKQHIKIVPQRTMNSFLAKELYPQENPFDTLGTSSQYVDGDLLLHLPGIPLANRIDILSKFLSIVRK